MWSPIYKKYWLARKQWKHTSRYRKSHSRAISKGVDTPHDYSVPSINPLTWWADVALTINKQRTVVYLLHPRYEYRNLCHEEAYRWVSEKYPQDCPVSKWLEGGTPNYKKVGNSRKKIASYTMDNTNRPDSYFDEWTAKEEELVKSATHAIKPSWKISLQAYGGYFIELIYPIEIQSNADCVKLAQLVRRMLQARREGKDPFAEVAGYTYSAADWNKETSELDARTLRDTSLAVKL